MIKRIFDLLLASLLWILLWIPMIIIGLMVKLTSEGSILYWSDRIGQNNRLFKMPKFRTMKTGTPVVATHLLTDAKIFLTPVGRFLRRSSLDELPQLWCILKGEMSFVGPRPALYNQDDLIAQRTKKGIDKLLPGLTGWAQINGRDELPVSVKVRLDEEYLHAHSFLLDLKILWLTAFKVFQREGIRH